MSCLSPRPQHTCQKCSGALLRGTYLSGNTVPPRAHDEDDDDDDDADGDRDDDDDDGDGGVNDVK